MRNSFADDILNDDEHRLSRLKQDYRNQFYTHQKQENVQLSIKPGKKAKLIRFQTRRKRQ